MNSIPFKTRLGLELFRAYRAIQIKLHELNYLLWECTLRCNLNCKHCGSDCTRDSEVPDMPAADFLRILDKIAEEYNPHNVMIAITGGEPLLREDLEDCGRQIYKKGFPWGIVSNGYLLTAKRLVSLIRSGLRSVTVSLDGLQDTHNWLRGKNDSFQKALQAIKFCASEHDLVFDVVTCVNKRNISELKEIKDLLLKTGVRKWRLFTIFPKGRATPVNELSLSDSEFRQMMDFIADCRNRKIIEVSYGCEGFLGEYEGKVRGSYFFCRAGINVASVLADGSISACPSLREDFTQGNIYKDDFLTCWHNRYGDMRNRNWARTNKCKDCREFRYCNGNGLHLRVGPEKQLVMCHYEKIKGMSNFRDF